MAVKNIKHLDYNWRPRTLRFAHWREGGSQVAFHGDSTVRATGKSAGLLYGHERESSFAVLVHLYHHHRETSVEVDGVRIAGTLEKPDDSTGRVVFRPKAYRDGSKPSPTRPMGYFRWREGRDRYLAECRVTQADADGPWELAAPYAVEADNRRLLPRVAVPRGWAFKPSRAGAEPFHEPARVLGTSLTGASLLVSGKWILEDFREPFITGAILHSSGKSLPMRISVVHAHDHPNGTMLGVSYSMVGLYGLRRLGRWISER